VSGELRAPFPWFGGKFRAAGIIWEALGDCANYVEPFAGSLAVLLARPTAPRVETVNDLDAYLANFWRAVQHAPGEVARHADAPVNEADLHAWHRWLVNGLPDEGAALRSATARALEALGSGHAELARDILGGALTETRRPLGPAFRARMRSDPEYFDTEVAGRWVWGISQWIGSGWCTNPEWEGRAHPGNGLRGIHGRKASGAQWQQLPDLSGSRGATGRGVHASGKSLEGVHAWMQALGERLRRVRVCCGDWSRVLKPSATVQIGTTGVLLDPPYEGEEDVYGQASEVSRKVREWALENGDNPELRIALCGYEGEHQMPDTWRCVAWEAVGGYAAARGNKENAKRERVWLSPHCLRDVQADLFKGLAARAAP
jgi:DNA adenine methylase